VEPVPVVVDLGDVAHPDLSDVDAVARLQLMAKRLGLVLRVRHASDEFLALMAFVGLPVEVDRQPEGGEELGVQEVMQPGDPTA
jgi:hypothetical protein